MAATDVLIIGALLFALTIVGFVVYFGANAATTQMMALPLINSSAPTMEVLHTVETNSNRLDGFLFAIFIALTLALWITGYFVGGHPIFMIIYFVVIVVAVIAAMIMANTWELVSTASIFGTTVNNFPIMNHVLLNLPLYLAIIGLVGLILMFAKPALGGGDGNL